MSWEIKLGLGLPSLQLSVPSCVASLPSFSQQSLVQKSSEVQLTEIQGATVTSWYFFRLALFYLSIKKETFKISKPLNIGHEEKQRFTSPVPSRKNLRWDQISCLFCEHKIDNVSANIGFCQCWFHLLGKN